LLEFFSKYVGPYSIVDGMKMV